MNTQSQHRFFPLVLSALGLVLGFVSAAAGKELGTSPSPAALKLTDEPEQEQVSAEGTVGVRLSAGPYAADADLSGSLSYQLVAGKLPPGVKPVVATNGVYLAGVPSKAGAYQPVLRILSKTGGVSTPVANLAFDVTISALPEWAQGSFNGYVSTGGPATMKVTAAGKVTGKISTYGVTYSFTVDSFASGSETNGFSIVTYTKAGSQYYLVTMVVTQVLSVAGMGVANGRFAGTPQLRLWRNQWVAGDEALQPFIGYYTATVPGGSDFGSCYLTLTVDKLGKVKVGGKLADGTSVSMSGMLIRDENLQTFILLYVAPTAYKAGFFTGLIQFVESDGGETVDLQLINGTRMLWFNYNPLATEDVAEGGFKRYLQSLTGGWYNKTTNLVTYYEGKSLTTGVNTNAPVPELTVGTNRYESGWWSPAGLALTPTLRSGGMTGLLAPAAGKPTDADADGVWDYESAVNTVGLKVSLARPTGVFKGSFKAWFDYPLKKHVSKNLTVEGVLTPERKDRTDGVEGRGYFLWADKSSYTSTAGKQVTYSFNRSYDFLLLSE